MKAILKYFVLLIYSCISSMLMLLFLGGCVAVFYYLKDGVFYFPLSQIKRAIFFGGVAGTAITMATIVFNIHDKINEYRK